MTDTPKIIQGREFIQALLDAGIVTPGERVSRIVIDARVTNEVTMYVERFGDARLLDLIPALTTATIVHVEPPIGSRRRGHEKCTGTLCYAPEDRKGCWVEATE